MELALDLAKIVLPALMVFLTAFFVLKSYLENEQKKKELDARAMKDQAEGERMPILRDHVMRRIANGDTGEECLLRAGVLLDIKRGDPCYCAVIMHEQKPLPEGALMMIANCGGVLPANRPAIDNYHEARTPSLDRNDDGRALVEDTDKDGFDDKTAPNFGLDNATVATADCWEATPDNRFNIFYNFAIDVPFPRTVTIKIIVQELNTTAAPVTFTYIKDDII